MAQTAPSYDEQPYTGLAYWFSHPDHLGVMGALRGLATARANACRVLELGCGDGGNLLSLAALLPGSRFVGVDLSAVHIARAREVAQTIGRGNVTFHHADLMDFSVEPGAFDYVIAHGVYSWVPEAVRDALLALAARALAPSGVAVVSYNTLPGQATFQPVRQLMRFHTALLSDAAAKIRQARSIAALWCDYIEDSDRDGRGPAARRIANMLPRVSDQMIRHDWLSEVEAPILFSDFIAHARRHGLDYLDNALPSAQRPENLEPETHELLASLEDPVRVQQYFDFFDETRFRATLLARADAPRGAPLSFDELAFESRLDPSEEVDPSGIPRVVMETPTGNVELADLATRIALGVVVGRAPEAIPMRDLAPMVQAQLLPEADPEDPFPATEAGLAALRSHLGTVLPTLWRRDVVHLWRDPPPAPRGGLPETGALQRLFAAEGREVPNLYHRHTGLRPKELRLLAALDGRTEIAALTERFGPETERKLRELAGRRLLL